MRPLPGTWTASSHWLQCTQPRGLAVATVESTSFRVCPFWGQEGALEGPSGHHWAAGAGTWRLKASIEMTCGWPRRVRLCSSPAGGLGRGTPLLTPVLYHLLLAFGVSAPGCDLLESN